MAADAGSIARSWMVEVNLPVPWYSAKPFASCARPSILVDEGQGALWALSAPSIYEIFRVNLEGSGPDETRLGWDRGAKRKRKVQMCVCVLTN